MEGLHWLQVPSHQLIAALGIIGFLFAIIIRVGDVLNAIDTIRSHATAIARRLTGKPAQSDKPDKPLLDPGSGVEPAAKATSDGVEVRTPVRDDAKKLDQPILFFLLGNIVNTVNTVERDAKRQRAKRNAATRQLAKPSKPDGLEKEASMDDGATPTGSLSPTEADDAVEVGSAASSTSTSDATAGGPSDVPKSKPPNHIPTVSFLTPQEAKSQAGGENDNVTVVPASITKGSTEPSSDMAIKTDRDAMIEPVPIDPESPSIDNYHSAEDAQSVPASGNEAASIPDDTSAQAHAEESPYDQARLTGQSTTDVPKSDLPENSRVTDSDTAASAAEAIPSAQLSTPINDANLPISEEQDMERDRPAPAVTLKSDAEDDVIDEDIDNITNGWSAAAIGATLQRLRRARGLLTTDVSYDSGWVMALEAGCWYTREIDRQCFDSGIKTYLRALGMTAAELHACLVRQDRSR